MPNNPPAGTPNAVEEARKSLRLNYGLALAGCGMGEADCNEGLASIDALIAAARTQAFADVRQRIAELDWRGPVSGTGCTVLTADVFRALDALSSEGK